MWLKGTFAVWLKGTFAKLNHSHSPEIVGSSHQHFTTFSWFFNLSFPNVFSVCHLKWVQSYWSVLFLYTFFVYYILFVYERMLLTLLDIKANENQSLWLTTRFYNYWLARRIIPYKFVCPDKTRAAFSYVWPCFPNLDVNNYTNNWSA